LPKTAAALYGRRILRASLRTGEFGEARRRLMDNLAWARELIDAPDLEALGAVIHGRLQGYTAAGAPDNERALAERVGFEHQARHYMARANERGYAFPQRFERFATKWVDFVDQNKAGPSSPATRAYPIFATDRFGVSVISSQEWFEGGHWSRQFELTRCAKSSHRQHLSIGV
jgi:hypothetical protein